MALKEESPNEGTERLQERSCGLAGHVGGGEGQMGAFSLGTHDRQPHQCSVLSKQCNRLAANKVLLCRKRDEVFFDGRGHLFSEHMSSQQVKRGEVLHSEATDASADGGLGCVQS